MKKLILALCVCAGLCACSSDDDLVSSSSSEMPDGTVSYLKVRIKDVNSSTRAESGGYAYGTEDEYKVNNAYFYFYDKDGNYVAKGNATPTGTANDANPTANIEWSSETVVAVWGIADTSLPTQMLTVLNQPSSFDGTNKTLAQATAALAGTPWGDATNGFIMTTSTYEGISQNGDTEGAVMNITALTADDFRSEPVDIEDDYADGGVDVYVERLAAKVGLNVDSEVYTTIQASPNYYVPITDLMWEEWAKIPNAVTADGTYYIQLLGWNVDAIARDAYLSKHIDTEWNLGYFDWNAGSNHRSYWAESPAYGDESHAYQASNWKLNTPEEEADASTWLDDYLEYTSLETPINFGSATYIGENTNSQTVINALAAADSSSCFTDALVKAQFVSVSSNSGTPTPVDIVKYHGEYLTLADFEADMISEVIRYDFSSMVDEVADALNSSSLGSNPLTSGILHTFVDAIEPTIYMKAKEGSDTDYEEFDSRFVQLINKGNGYVGIWFDTATSIATDESSHSNHSDATGKTIPDDYDSPIVKAAAESMDDYDFYFKLDGGTMDTLGSTLLELLQTLGFITISDDSDFSGESYYLPLSDEFTINVYQSDGTTVDHAYTARNYLIRVIERESAGIDDDWDTAGYPNLYADGLMYYYVPIEHLAENTSSDTIVEGQYGVVRNHWYEITVTSISDFGHGIADEKEVIVPAPELPYYYMGADINILSWQMVNQSVAW